MVRESRSISQPTTTTMPISRPIKLLGALTMILAAALSADAADELKADAPVRQGLQVWLDAADLRGLQIQEGRLTAWRDRSGSGHDGKVLGRPTRIGGAGSEPALVRFSGPDALVVDPITVKPGPITAFVVSRRIDAQADGPAWQRLISIRAGDTPDNKPPNACLTTGAKSPAYPMTVKVFIKDALPVAPIVIGGRRDPGDKIISGFRGDIAEVLVYDRGFVSEGAVRDVMNYLSKKWNAQIDREDGGWTRAGPLGETPRRENDQWPLCDQSNRGDWLRFPEFSDEFNAGGLNDVIWTTTYAWKGRPPGLFRASNVTIKDGLLELAMRNETVPEMKKDPKYHTYTSAFLHTRRLTRYGYFEVRARPMNSAGSSSFWFAHGVNDWRTEIDVFEIGGKAPGRENAYHMNCHVFTEKGVKDHWHTGGVWQAPWRLADDFHVYGLEWTPEKITFHVDGVAVRSMVNTHWHKPMRMIFDSETMPDWFGLPDVKDLPSFFHIDYVRAWKKPGWDGAVTPEEAAAKKWLAPGEKD